MRVGLLRNVEDDDDEDALEGPASALLLKLGVDCGQSSFDHPQMLSAAAEYPQ